MYTVKEEEEGRGVGAGAALGGGGVAGPGMAGGKGVACLHPLSFYQCLKSVGWVESVI